MSLDVGPICQRLMEERDKDMPGSNMSLHMVGRGKRRKKILKSNKKVKIPQMDELHVLMGHGYISKACEVRVIFREAWNLVLNFEISHCCLASVGYLEEHTGVFRTLFSFSKF